MATSEGMTGLAGLRERLRADESLNWIYESEVDAVLDAIEAAGYRIVAVDRLERVTSPARGAQLLRQGATNEDRMAGLLMMDVALAKVQPGDLDAVGEGT